MKKLVSIILISIGFHASAQELCGVPVLPYGCDVDDCTVEVQTRTGSIQVRVDSDSLIRQSDLVNMARAKGTQCFEGYVQGGMFTITGFAD